MDTIAAYFYRTFMTSKEQSDVSYDITYPSLFWLFLLGSVAGFGMEGLWCILTKGHWERHSATVLGPFCIIYGIGAVAVYLLAALLKNRSLLLQFVAFMVSGTAVEYFASLFQERCFGTVTWDYSGHVLNLGGRVSLMMTLLWGFLGMAFTLFVFPHVNRLLHKMKGRGWRIVCAGMTIFMVVNLLVSSAAITRWRTRGEEPQASNPVVQWLDNTYDDQTMARLFPNMRFLAE